MKLGVVVACFVVFCTVNVLSQTTPALKEDFEDGSSWNWGATSGDYTYSVSSNYGAKGTARSLQLTGGGLAGITRNFPAGNTISTFQFSFMTTEYKPNGLVVQFTSGSDVLIEFVTKYSYMNVVKYTDTNINSGSPLEQYTWNTITFEVTNWNAFRYSWYLNGVLQAENVLPRNGTTANRQITNMFVYNAESTTNYIDQIYLGCPGDCNGNACASYKCPACSLDSCGVDCSVQMPLLSTQPTRLQASNTKQITFRVNPDTNFNAGFRVVVRVIFGQVSSMYARTTSGTATNMCPHWTQGSYTYTGTVPSDGKSATMDFSCADIPTNGRSYKFTVLEYQYTSGTIVEAYIVPLTIIGNGAPLESNSNAVRFYVSIPQATTGRTSNLIIRSLSPLSTGIYVYSITKGSCASATLNDFRTTTITNNEMRLEVPLINPGQYVVLVTKSANSMAEVIATWRNCPGACGNGMCVNDQCVCPPYWSGPACATEECRCNGHGTCDISYSAYDCTCDPGWYGVGCTCNQETIGMFQNKTLSTDSAAKRDLFIADAIQDPRLTAGFNWGFTHTQWVYSLSLTPPNSVRGDACTIHSNNFGAESQTWRFTACRIEQAGGRITLMTSPSVLTTLSQQYLYITPHRFAVQNNIPVVTYTINEFVFYVPENTALWEIYIAPDWGYMNSISNLNWWPVFTLYKGGCRNTSEPAYAVASVADYTAQVKFFGHKILSLTNPLPGVYNASVPTVNSGGRYFTVTSKMSSVGCTKTCSGFGVCQDNVCVCDVFHTGPNCEIEKCPKLAVRENGVTDTDLGDKTECGCDNTECYCNVTKILQPNEPFYFNVASRINLGVEEKSYPSGYLVLFESAPGNSNGLSLIPQAPTMVARESCIPKAIDMFTTSLSGNTTLKFLPCEISTYGALRVLRFSNYYSTTTTAAFTVTLIPKTDFVITDFGVPVPIPNYFGSFYDTFNFNVPAQTTGLFIRLDLIGTAFNSVTSMRASPGVCFDVNSPFAKNATVSAGQQLGFLIKNPPQGTWAFQPRYPGNYFVHGNKWTLTITLANCDNTCSGNGLCYDGSCVCEAPWTGLDCSIDTRSPATKAPTKAPTATPTKQPTPPPTLTPTKVPTNPPTPTATIKPTTEPTLAPGATAAPTTNPTTQPTPAPTTEPTAEPTTSPTTPPTTNPTTNPTTPPTSAPTINPTTQPTPAPTTPPTISPTLAPGATWPPTPTPTIAPTTAPTPTPTPIPTTTATRAPTTSPSTAPTFKPTTPPTLPPGVPSEAPSTPPTTTPTLPPGVPSEAPTKPPTLPPGAPSEAPTTRPTLPPGVPSETPTTTPTLAPGTPTDAPTTRPTTTPTTTPTIAATRPGDTAPPTKTPTIAPTDSPVTITVTVVFEISLQGNASQFNVTAFAEAMGALFGISPKLIKVELKSNTKRAEVNDFSIKVSFVVEAEEKSQIPPQLADAATATKTLQTAMNNTDSPVGQFVAKENLVFKSVTADVTAEERKSTTTESGTNIISFATPTTHATTNVFVVCVVSLIVTTIFVFI